MPGIYASALQMSINRGTPERGGSRKRNRTESANQARPGNKARYFPNPSLDP